MLRRLLFLTLIAAVITIFFRTFVVEGIYVASASMEPTLRIKTFLFLEKITYYFRNPKRGDIIVFLSPIEKKKDLIKRVIAVGGEKIQIKNKIVYIDEQKFLEKYIKHSRPTELLVGDNLGPLTVPKGMLFVMGDNRDESNDSRDWIDSKTKDNIYFIPVSKVKGRIVNFYD